MSAGHARALITSENPSELAKQVIKKGLSVRETEKLAKRGLDNIFSDPSSPKKKMTVQKDADTKALEGDLAANLGMKVSLNHKPGQEGGSLTIAYDSLDQLDDLCRKLTGA